MDKTSFRVIEQFGNIRLIQLNYLDWDGEHDHWFEYTSYVVQVYTTFCLGIFRKWSSIQSWVVGVNGDDYWCFNEAKELYNIITNKYGEF